MASIGRLTNSWATAYNENTVALANFNFDFSLYKVEAPKEYRDVETSLSSLRRQKAEDGTMHQTARRLGALFEDTSTMPPIPKLINAYGQRASEISRKLEPKSEASKTYGPFSAHIGIDASSIWASATSGPSAIAIHLLACILARTWTGSEATSIWTEIVSERKKEVEEKCQAGAALPIATLLAARQDIARSQLAEWDASARSWLQSADEVKCREQKQLMLILNNVEIAVNNKSQTYSNVLAAWKAAMGAMENLLSGVALRIQDGAVLLGFAAWHMFPNIVVLGPTLAEVHFKDTLVPEGAILEIGLHSSGSQKRSEGVFWSLSLAHLRYYGTPVSVSRSLTYDASRVSIDQLYIIALGSITNNWIPPAMGRKLEEPLKWFKTIGERMGNCTGWQFSEYSWFDNLVTAACTVLDSKDLEAKHSSLLLSYGRSQAKHFIPNTPPFFGLNKYNTLCRLTESTQARITHLLCVMRKLGLSTSDCIIRHRRSGESFSSLVLASEIPTSLAHLYDVPESGIVTNSDQYTIKEGLSQKTVTLRLTQAELRRLSPNARKRQRLNYGDVDIKRQADSDEDFLLVMGDPNTECLLVNVKAVRVWLQSHGYHISEEDPSGQIERLLDRGEEGSYNPLLAEVANSKCDLQALKEILFYVDSSALRAYLESKRWEQTPAMISLTALAGAASLYKSFPEATVPLEISRRPLSDTSYVKSWQSNGPEIWTLTRAEKFSCLALFETGSCDLRPDQLESVMAMSVGNGLYISKCLLSDPVHNNNHSGLRRAVGNIGRPGISLLYSPANVQIRPQRLDSWMLMDLQPFNGEKMDSFPSTSMHLNFTGYELPLSSNRVGERDVEATLIETAVSVLDRGQWVADIDILRYSLTNNGSPLSCVFQLKDPTTAAYLQLLGNTDSMKCDHGDTMPKEFPFLRVDSWDKLLSDLEEPVIVATHNNLFARLGTAAVSVQKDRRIYVLAEDACMKCVAEFLGKGLLWRENKPCVVIM